VIIVLLIKTQPLLVSFLVTGNSAFGVVPTVTERGCKDKHCVKKVERGLDTVPLIYALIAPKMGPLMTIVSK
jgi:hypothetical protein